ncbi:hypothetical protein C6P46_004831 [Rhodotorula mucilaginosa]|uniref:Uncharacterized protein n=1 Tax=Rhodotorula mucilaginosa TaxID=5537 RepID=A0A9P7B612_RHOMI|nr:hypothetical protein C6P46_004831 [Rhodotorula mucilaginosa]
MNFLADQSTPQELVRTPTPGSTRTRCTAAAYFRRPAESHIERSGAELTTTPPRSTIDVVIDLIDRSLDVACIGLQNAGKSSLVTVLTDNHFTEEMIPTVTFQTAQAELHALLDKPELRGIPLLVLANKNDLPDHATVDEVIKALALSTITNREVSCYSISAKSSRNIDITLAWLMKRA